MAHDRIDFNGHCDCFLSFPVAIFHFVPFAALPCIFFRIRTAFATSSPPLLSTIVIIFHFKYVRRENSVLSSSDRLLVICLLLEIA